MEGIRSACVPFYQQIEQSEVSVRSCPFGFDIAVQVLTDLCEKPAAILAHVANPAGGSIPVEVDAFVRTLPRKTKKLIQSLRGRVPAWQNCTDAEAAIVAIADGLGRRLEERDEHLFETVVAEYGDFVASFSHEALSPIQQIRTTLERAALRIQPGDEEAYHLVTSALNGLDGVRVSLEGMRLLFRGDDSVMENQFRQVDVRPIVEHWLALYQSQVDGKNLDVIVEPGLQPWPLFIVKEYFEVFVRNLLSNAIKYSFDATGYDEPGKIIISVPARGWVKPLCARQGLGEEEAGRRAETFRSDPAGNQSRPVEVSHQPEPSVAPEGQP